MAIDANQLDTLREAMVDRQLRARGIRSRLVLEAMRMVRREHYVSSYLGEFAYEDAPLPIAEEQTISQPYMVAFMLEALRLRGGERVLEVGTGSGYAAAVLAQIAGDVFTMERHERLAEAARERLAADGCTNVHVRHGDGTLGWAEHAPYDAIVVAAGAPRVPEALRQQLAVGGRLVLLVGDPESSQRLVRVIRRTHVRYEQERLADVRFVPLVGEQGWRVPVAEPVRAPAQTSLAAAVARGTEAFDEPDHIDLQRLLKRIGRARIVLLGESTHGTAEFYRFRAQLTRALVERAGFTIVAAEADWPDAARIDRHVGGHDAPRGTWRTFGRFPTWMWRNREFAEFVEWLRAHNATVPGERRVRFAGLDLYAMHHSIDAVLRHLDGADAAAAAVARQRYGCLTPWQHDPAAYGQAVLTEGYRSCETDVVRVLHELLRQRMREARDGNEAWFDAVQNARLVANAEDYYRRMYYGSHEAWNLRDRHMCDCLQQLLEFHGPAARIVVWAHNSHVGDARATEVSARGERNLGQLCRQEFATREVYIVGFGTDHGTVAAASYWGGDVETKQVRPALAESYERVCHDGGIPVFLLPLRDPLDARTRDLLVPQRLQRAIGVIYRPETERASHYLHASLPAQFDELVWFDATNAVQPLTTNDAGGVPDTWPSGM